MSIYFISGHLDLTDGRSRPSWRAADTNPLITTKSYD
jgi:hypothetical protein